MENASRNTISPRNRDPAPWVMPAVTVAAFGGAFAVCRLGPWGILTAAVLLVGWVAIVLDVAERQRHRDLASGRIVETPPRKPSRLARSVQLLFLMAAGACFFYGAWLQRQGAAPTVTQEWSDRALLLVLLTGVLALVTDVLELALNRLRTGRAKEP